MTLSFVALGTRGQVHGETIAIVTWSYAKTKAGCAVGFEVLEMMTRLSQSDVVGTGLISSG